MNFYGLVEFIYFLSKGWTVDSASTEMLLRRKTCEESNENHLWIQTQKSLALVVVSSDIDEFEITKSNIIFQDVSVLFLEHEFRSESEHNFMVYFTGVFIRIVPNWKFSENCTWNKIESPKNGSLILIWNYLEH